MNYWREADAGNWIYSCPVSIREEKSILLFFPSVCIALTPILFSLCEPSVEGDSSRS